MTQVARKALVLVATAAMAISVVALIGQRPAIAASSTISTTIACTTGSTPSSGSGFSASIEFNSVPESVEVNEAFNFTIKAINLKNGGPPAAVGQASVYMYVDTEDGNGSVQNDRRSGTWSNPSEIASGGTFTTSALSVSATAPSTPGTLELKLDRLIIEAQATETFVLVLTCWSFDGSTRNHPSISIPVTEGSGETTTTDGGDTTTTTVGGDTTTTTVGVDTTTTSVIEDTTTTSIEDTTTTTLPRADYLSASKSISYGCAVTVSGSALGTEFANQTITITAPDRVNPGMEFTVVIKMSPGPESGPVPLPAGTQKPSAKILTSGNASPSSKTVYGGTIGRAISPNSIMPIPAMSGKFTATGSPGDVITFSAGNFVVDSPSLDARTTCRPGSTPGIISTQIVSEPIVLDDGTLPSTGLSDHTFQIILALVALYIGALFLSTLPSRRPSTAKQYEELP